MSKRIIFVCPICGEKSGKFEKPPFDVGDLIECPRCLNILRVKSDYSLEDFVDILRKNQTKRKADSKLDASDCIEVKSFEDIYYET